LGPPADAEGTPTPSIREPVELTRLKPRPTARTQTQEGTRRSFGVHFEAHEPLIERSIVEEIDALSEETSGEYETTTYGPRSFAVIGIGVFLAAVGLGFLGVWLWASYPF
jgi:hypothetical protein